MEQLSDPMEHNDLYQRIRALLIEEFEVPPEAISPDARTREDLGLDSLDHVDLVVELERFAGHRIESEELTALKTVADAVELLRSHLPDGSAPVGASVGHEADREPSDESDIVPHASVDSN